MTQFARRPYLLLALLPVTLLGLDSYGWLVQRSTHSSGALQGQFPRFVAADQPVTLKLAGPQSATLKLARRDGGETRLIPSTPAPQEGLLLNLPPLAPGHYTAQWLGADQSALGAAQDLRVTPAPQARLWSDRSLARPGESLQISAWSPQPLSGTLSLYDAHGQLLTRQSLSTATGSAASSPRGALLLRLPEQAAAGQAQLVWQTPKGRFYQGVRLETPAVTQGLRVSSVSPQLVRGVAQKHTLLLTTADGQPVEQGWLRVGGQTLSVQQGRAELSLSAAQSQSPPAYTAGDSRGNLSQGRLPLALRDWGVLPSDDGGRTWQWLARSPGQLAWSLGQGHTLLAQGRLSHTGGATPLPLPLDKAEPGPVWLSLRWGDGLATVSWELPPQAWPRDWKLTPANPHALQPVLLTGPPQLPDAITQTGGERLLPLLPLAGAGQAQLQELSPPATHQGHPFWLSLWGLGGLAAALLPLLWLGGELRRLLRRQKRPFPSAQVRRQLRQAQWLSAANTGLALFSLPVLWLGWVAPALSLSALSLLLQAAGAGWFLRRLWPQGHPLLAWVPSLQGLLLACNAWFMLTYAPATLGAGLLTLAGAQSVWLAVFLALGPRRQASQTGTALLASLSVMSVCHLLLLPQLLTLPSPDANPQTESWQVGLPRRSGPLLGADWQMKTPLLKAPQQGGARQIEVRQLSASGRLQAWQTTLPTQPAVRASWPTPAYLLLGDRLEIPVQLSNDTANTQLSAWRWQSEAVHEVKLAPRAQQADWQSYSALRPGWQTLSLAHRFGGQWYPQTQRIFVQSPEPTRQHPLLQLSVELPKASDLVRGEEIPVLVRFRQGFAGPEAVGLQLGIPAGFDVLTEALSDRRHQSWLADLSLGTGYLNLRSQALKPGEERAFHFRLRARWAGRFQMPSQRLFVLDQPGLRTVLPPLWLEVSP
ncbi:MAG: hypothetical protein ACO1RX_11785 [Candidatus Sericytochromatia bacterium]